MHLDKERFQIITLIIGMNGIELLNLLENLQNVVLRDKELLIAEKPSWNVVNDARITSVNNLFSSLARTRLELQFLGELLDDDWWLDHSPESTPNMKIDHLISFEKLIKYSFGMDFFTYVESSFRIFLRVLDPNACNNGSGPFKNIYECLFGAKQLAFIGGERTSAIELLILIRLIRNLIHNNGIFFSDDGQNEIVNYKGRIFTFVHGKPVDFMYWSLLIEIADDIRQLLIKVISHPKIKSIPHILDPMCI